MKSTLSASQCHTDLHVHLWTSCVRMCCLSGHFPSRPPLAAHQFQLKAVTLQQLSLRPPPYISSSVPACTKPQKTCQPCGPCIAQLRMPCRLHISTVGRPPGQRWMQMVSSCSLARAFEGSAECACMQLNIRLSMQVPTELSNVGGLRRSRHTRSSRACTDECFICWPIPGCERMVPNRYACPLCALPGCFPGVFQ